VAVFSVILVGMTIVGKILCINNTDVRWAIIGGPENGIIAALYFVISATI